MTGWLHSFFVTVQSSTGGESPRSETVFWDCDANPGYAKLDPIPSRMNSHDAYAAYDAIAAIVPTPGETLVTDLEPATPESPLDREICSTDDDLPVQCEVMETLLTLGQSSGDPPYEVHDLHVDHLGSTRFVTSDNGSTISMHDFLPFGEEILPLADVNRKMFTGHERDTESGLDYMYARYYSHSANRFFAADSDHANVQVQLVPTWNGYTYTDNNPVRFIDADGRFTKEDHNAITLAATGDQDIADATEEADHLIPGVIRGGNPIFFPRNHFGGAKRGDALLERAIAAKNEGEERKARRLLGKALHAYQDDIAHRAPDGRRIGYFEHAARNVADFFRKLFGKGCKFSPDCPNREDYGRKKDAATKKTAEKKKEFDERTKPKENGYGIDPDGPYGPKSDPCNGRGPACRGGAM